MLKQREEYATYAPGLARVMELIRGCSGKCSFKISGGTCSGKTFLAKDIRNGLAKEGMESSTVPLDPFFKDISDPTVPRTPEGLPCFDLPDSYHGEEYRLRVSDILSGNDIWIPKYDVANNRRLSDRGEPVPASPLVIAEGLFTIAILDGSHPQMTRVYVYTDQATVLQRRIERDTRDYGYTEEYVREFFRLKIAPFQHVVEAQKGLADIVIKT